MLNRDSKIEVWSRFVWNLWYELNPRVRCAFGNVFFLVNPWKLYPNASRGRFHVCLCDTQNFHTVTLLEIEKFHDVTSSENKGRGLRCLELSLSSSEVASTPTLVTMLSKRATARVKKEEASSRDCNTSAPTTRLEGASMPEMASDESQTEKPQHDTFTNWENSSVSAGSASSTLQTILTRKVCSGLIENNHLGTTSVPGLVLSNKVLLVLPLSVRYPAPPQWQGCSS